MMFGKGTNYFSRLSGHECKSMLRDTLNTTFCAFRGRLAACTGVHLYSNNGTTCPDRTHDAITVFFAFLFQTLADCADNADISLLIPSVGIS